MGLFTRKNNISAPIPAALVKPDEPVNYSSVLDYLVGLSKDDHAKIIQVTDIYREANEKAAAVLGVEDQPTTMLKQEPNGDAIDDALDDALNTDHLDFIAEDTPAEAEAKKEQAPSASKKIDVQG